MPNAPVQLPDPNKDKTNSTGFDLSRRRLRFLGLTADDLIKYFFEGNAVVSVVVLGLITLFLFREGMDFFGQNRKNLEIYRRAGLEYVDILRAQEQEHTALTRYLSDLRVRAVAAWTAARGEGVRAGAGPLSVEQANERLVAFDAFANGFGDAAGPLRGLVSDLGDVCTALKTKYQVLEDKKEARRQLMAENRISEAGAVKVDEIDFVKELVPLRDAKPAVAAMHAELTTALEALLRATPQLEGGALQERLDRFVVLARQYLAGLPEVRARLEAWDPLVPVPWHSSFTAFLFGREWLTASFWQDWYGILPLFMGSLLVSCVALALAVPFGVGAAIYVNQLASLREQKIIKPCIEFISAIPSVVLGFFGIAVLGQALRAASQWEWLSWMPGFPFSERLNVLTAGCLLALIAVPTIFTLAEDALNNVPRAFKEASLALGATRLQTILRIVAPAALSGIISAVLLGLGRVIGETMVVLLCAGNRIAIPDFTAGLGVVAQPVHTMTGIIAQEMGEVVRGSIHYRALFVVGIALFFLSLLINYVAQGIVRRYRLSVG